MTASQTKGLYAALLEVQKEAPQLHKDAKAEVPTKSGGKYSYTYLTLEALLSAVLPILHAHDVVLVQAPSFVEGLSTLKTTLYHVPSQEGLETEMYLLGANDSQALGSAISYARRYSLMSMLGLVAEDDDGQKASRTKNFKPQSNMDDGNGSGDPQFVPPTGKPITAARRKKLDALIAQLVATPDTEMQPEHVEAWCEKHGTTYEEITTGLADELEKKLLNLAKNSGLVTA